MGDVKYQALGDGDLTPEQLDGMDLWDRDVMLDERHRAVGSMLVRRAIAEIRRHRADRAASAERVRAVVREAVDAELRARGYRGALGNQLAPILDGIADRVAARLTAPPPGHVCPVPYGLGPEDVDEIEAARNFVGRHGGFQSTIDVLGKILAAHRAPTPTIEPLPEVIACGTAGCVSSIKKHLLPAGWLLLDGRWRCPRCKVIATPGAS